MASLIAPTRVLIDIDELATGALSIAKGTLYKLGVPRSAFPYIKAGRCLRFDLTDAVFTALRQVTLEEGRQEVEGAILDGTLPTRPSLVPRISTQMESGCRRARGRRTAAKAEKFLALRTAEIERGEYAQAGQSHAFRGLVSGISSMRRPTSDHGSGMNRSMVCSSERGAWTGCSSRISGLFQSSDTRSNG